MSTGSAKSDHFALKMRAAVHCLPLFAGGAPTKTTGLFFCMGQPGFQRKHSCSKAKAQLQGVTERQFKQKQSAECSYFCCTRAATACWMNVVASDTKERSAILQRQPCCSTASYPTRRGKREARVASRRAPARAGHDQGQAVRAAEADFGGFWR